MAWSDWIPTILAALGTVALAAHAQVGTAPQTPSGDSAPTSGVETPTLQPGTSQPSTSPRRLTIQVSVADPNDLKVKEGDRVTEGQLIADRGRERERLTSHQARLELSLTQLKGATITPPLPPAQPPAMAALPTESYMEQEAAIERAKTEVEARSRAIDLKQDEIAYLQKLPNLNPLVLEHERVKLEELQSAHTAAVRDYQLAVGRLASAAYATARQEYQHRLNLTERVEATNRDRLEYQQQLAAYEQRLRDRDYQVSQTQLKLDEVNNAIASIAVVKAPYAGRVRRVKWLGQNPDGSLSVEITLMIAGKSDN